MPTAGAKEKAATAGAREIRIRITALGIDPDPIRVRTGDRVTWANDTEKDCVIIFDMPTCPFEHRDHHHPVCSYSVKAQGTSEPYLVGVDFKVEYQYSIRFSGRDYHRGSPKLIVNG